MAKNQTTDAKDGTGGKLHTFGEQGKAGKVHVAVMNVLPKGGTGTERPASSKNQPLKPRSGGNSHGGSRQGRN
jgi:hypothetical protein